jgi:hypothetical protein
MASLYSLSPISSGHKIPSAITFGVKERDEHPSLLRKSSDGDVYSKTVDMGKELQKLTKQIQAFGGFSGYAILNALQQMNDTKKCSAVIQQLNARNVSVPAMWEGYKKYCGKNIEDFADKFLSKDPGLQAVMNQDMNQNR